MNHHPHEVGAPVRKQFPPHGWYYGAVVEYALRGGSTAAKVLYRDGDVEWYSVSDAERRRELGEIVENASNHPEPLQEIARHPVGTPVRKHFGEHGWHNGYIRKAGVDGSDDDYYHVLYEDDDEEGFPFGDIEIDVLVLNAWEHLSKCRVCGNRFDLNYRGGADRSPVSCLAGGGSAIDAAAPAAAATSGLSCCRYSVCVDCYRRSLGRAAAAAVVKVEKGSDGGDDNRAVTTLPCPGCKSPVGFLFRNHPVNWLLCTHLQQVLPPPAGESDDEQGGGDDTAPPGSSPVKVEAVPEEAAAAMAVDAAAPIRVKEEAAIKDPKCKSDGTAGTGIKGPPATTNKARSARNPRQPKRKQVAPCRDAGQREQKKLHKSESSSSSDGDDDTADGAGEAVGNLTLPANMKNSGWNGFRKLRDLPRKMQDVLKLMDFLFGYQADEEDQDSFYDRFWTQACSPPGSTERPGHRTRKKLRDLQKENGDDPAVRWHEPRQEWAPRNKSDLEAFIRKLLDLDE